MDAGGPGAPGRAGHKRHRAGAGPAAGCGGCGMTGVAGQNGLKVKELGVEEGPGVKRESGLDAERVARAALSRLMEPQDTAGLALVQIAGATDALRIATGQVAAGPDLEREITLLLADSGAG